MSMRPTAANNAAPHRRPPPPSALNPKNVPLLSARISCIHPISRVSYCHGLTSTPPPTSQDCWILGLEAQRSGKKTREESTSVSPVRALGHGEQRSSGPSIPWRSADETKGLCCAKTEVAMNGLDGNVRSPGAARKREIHQSFSFINHL